MGARIAGAANVSGLMSYRDGKPADKRQLHYENRVTSDIFVAPTKPDGSFTADLPPGFYDLRAERGLILASKIRVDSDDVNVGHVVEPAPLDVRRLFERQGVAETIVESPAPATSNVISGRPLEAMKYGHEALAPFGAPVGTPAPQIDTAGRGYSGCGSIAGRDGITGYGGLLRGLDQIHEPSRAQNPYPLERTQIAQMPISTDDDRRLCGQRTFQHAIVRLVLFNHSNSLDRTNLLRKFGYRHKRVARSIRRPLEFSIQNTFDLLQYWLRDEHGDHPSSGQCEHLIGHATEVEG